MLPTRRGLLLALPFLLFVGTCTSQQRGTDRQPAVAGQFYPDQPEELKQAVAELFANAEPRMVRSDVAALIVPHAGYVFSGAVAASGFNQLNADKAYENVFLIGSSHRIAFEGASVYTSGDFLTPLGRVPVNRALGEELAKKEKAFSTRTDAHLAEHSLEVQLPLLQSRLKQPFHLVPILLGTGNPETCRSIAAALRPYFSEKNLFVISSDFSHYPSYTAALRIDKATADAILANSPSLLLGTLQRNSESGTPGLATSLCGWSSVLTLLEMTSAAKDIEYHAVRYRNSGDSPYGDKKGVVGYWAIAVTRRSAPDRASFSLGKADKTTLLTIARRSIEAAVNGRQLPALDAAKLSSALTTPCGAFVTLHEGGMLRGCIGRFDASEPLYKVVEQMALASATQDDRFKPVGPAELRELDIEISVLSPLSKISSIDQFQLGKHGIYMRKGMRSGTFLPQVAIETGWTKEEFLGHCARDKAGIGWEGWKEAELFIYETLIFSEKELLSPPE